VFTRQELPVIDRSRFASAEGLQRGAYVLSDVPGNKPDLILIASGSEIALSIAAQQVLAEKGVKARIVSMPSWDLFDAQSREYREDVLPSSIGARLAIEAGVSQGWHKYVGDKGDVLSLDHFGASAPGKVVFEKFGYTVDNVVARALRLLK
jgi:transketolase